MLKLNKVYNLDCNNFLSQIDSNSIDVIVSDPPYFKTLDVSWDNQWKTQEEYLDWCKSWLIECKRVLKDDGSMYIFGGIGRYSDSIIHLKLLLDKLDLLFQDWITFGKQRGNGNRKGWLYCREEILWYTKTDSYIWNEENQYLDKKRLFTATGAKNKSEYKRISNVWTDIMEVGFGNSVHNFNKLREETGHVCPKPIELIKRIIKAHTKENDVVLDLFSGSGSTALACLELNRNFISCDNDEKCVININNRIDKFLERNKIF